MRISRKDLGPNKNLQEEVNRWDMGVCLKNRKPEKSLGKVMLYRKPD